MATVHDALAIAVEHHQAGELERAEEIYRQVLRSDPNCADALHLLGVLAHQTDNDEVAVDCIRQAIALDPSKAAFHSNLGVAYRALEQLDEAAASYRRALGITPDYAEAHNNLGNVLKDLGQLDEAVDSFRRAVRIRPDYAEAHKNLGGVLLRRGELDEAKACCRRALQIDPDYAEAHWNYSHLCLLTGDFEHGWVEHEWRWKTDTFTPRPFHQPLWDGRPLNGKTILIHAEQGLGDTLQFIRYALPVKGLRGEVIVECQRPLVPLLRSCRGIDRLVARGDDLPAFDVHAPLLSLPGIFKTTLDTVPAEVPYVFAEDELIRRWRARLGLFDGVKIGINWQGSPQYPGDRYRSFPLACLAGLAGLPGVRLISLQKGPGTEQLGELGGRFPVVDLGSELDETSGPFMDTAAVMKSLDLVIACDTAIAHLAGALGAPLWLSLPMVGDWRWMIDRADSPWYPTARLFRQSRQGDWAGVFDDIKAALRERFSIRP